MPKPIRRRFTLLDLMILVGASGFGLGYVRLFWPTILGESEGVVDFACCYKCAALFVWPFSPALLIARLRGTTSERRLQFREPGFWANFAIVFSWTTYAVTGFIHEFTYNFPDRDQSFLEKFLPYSIWNGIWDSVLIVWCGLALSCRWKPQTTWIDRLGRFLGIFWVAMGITYFGHQYWLQHR